MRAFVRQHLFSILIIACAATAFAFPAPFTEIRGFRVARLMVPLIQVIMFGMGMKLAPSDFAEIVRRPWPVAVGAFLQFSVMPALGFLIARAVGLDGDLAAGVVLIGSAAGGVASNVIAYLAKANVALSVAMTTVSTLLSPLLTPLLMQVFAGRFIAVDVVAMVLSLVNMIVVPILLSQLARIVLERVRPGATVAVDRVLPLLSMTAICVIMTVCVAASRDTVKEAGLLLLAVAALHNTCGYLLGYWGARLLSRVAPISERDCRTVAIEVGMQNAGMSQALALDVLKSAAVSVAPTIFGVWMDFSGSLLAGWWARRDPDCCRSNRTNAYTNKPRR